MVKKGINIILLILIFMSLIVTLSGIHIIYSYDKAIDDIAVKVDNEIEEMNVIDNKDNHRSIEENVSEENKDIVYQNAIGVIIFESGKKIAIYDNPSDYHMIVGVGKIVNDSVLNMRGNSILLGHNDGSFSELEHVKTGDFIEVKTKENILKYKVFDAYVTEKDDPIPYKSSDDIMLTLITCYPFVYVGSTPKRYVVVANVV